MPAEEIPLWKYSFQVRVVKENEVSFSTVIDGQFPILEFAQILWANPWFNAIIRLLQYENKPASH